MKKNVKIAKELVKIAKNLIAVNEKEKDTNQVANKEGKYENFTGEIDWKGTKGQVSNATFELKSNGVVWERGTWERGTWYGGIWERGTWEKGIGKPKNA